MAPGELDRLIAELEVLRGFLDANSDPMAREIIEEAIADLEIRIARLKAEAGPPPPGSPPNRATNDQ